MPPRTRWPIFRRNSRFWFHGYSPSMVSVAWPDRRPWPCRGRRRSGAAGVFREAGSRRSFAGGRLPSSSCGIVPEAAASRQASSAMRCSPARTRSSRCLKSSGCFARVRSSACTFLAQGRLVLRIAGQELLSAGLNQLEHGLIAGGADHRREVGGLHLLLPDASGGNSSGSRAWRCGGTWAANRSMALGGSLPMTRSMSTTPGPARLLGRRGPFVPEEFASRRQSCRARGCSAKAR